MSSQSTASPERINQRRSLPWGRWTLRLIAISYLVILLVVPLLIIFGDAFRQGIGEFWRQVTLPPAFSALKLTLWTAAVMTIINTILSLIHI